MAEKKRIGIYGGTFNPPHLGHVKAAEAFRASVELDTLIIIPDYLPPHKQYISSVSAADRFEMCVLAFSHINGVEFSDIEIKRGGKSYTVNTLRELSNENSELFFLCGEDMFLTLDKWYQFEEIFRRATICYVKRIDDESKDWKLNSFEQMYRDKYGAKIIAIESDVVEVSSSEIREAILSDKDQGILLPESVLSYIKERGLYSDV